MEKLGHDEDALTRKDECTTQWEMPETAPKDGTIILGDFGYPWAVPAVWDPVVEEWATAQLSPCAPDESVEWQTEWLGHRRLKGWYAMPVIDSGKDEGVDGILTRKDDATCFGWVKTKDALPEDGEYVVHAYYRVRAPEYGLFNKGRFFRGNGPESFPATHWIRNQFIEPQNNSQPSTNDQLEE